MMPKLHYTYLNNYYVFLLFRPDSFLIKAIFLVKYLFKKIIIKIKLKLNMFCNHIIINSINV
jgi:hypothetical protein